MKSNIQESRLSQRDVERLLSIGVSAAQGRGVAVTIALVDAGGHLLGFLRMDGVHTATCDVAVAKARSSAAFRRPIRLFAEQLAAGNLSLLTIPGCVPLQGGIPFKLDETMIGAVGVSGAAPDIDEAIALAIVKDRSSNDLTSVS
jgi:glc operon protein GlcG